MGHDSDVISGRMRALLLEPVETQEQRERIDHPFGRIALEKKYVSRDQLEVCRIEQERYRNSGRRIRLAQILLKRGYLTTAQVLDVLSLQTNRLVPCRGCRRVYDLSSHPTGVRLRCLQCGEEIGESGKPASAPPPETGRKVGRYVLIREIGRGGMAVVYEAEDPELKRSIALKVLREDRSHPQNVRRLHREAAIAAQLRHPNIVVVHEVGSVGDEEAGSVHFIAMDLVRGRTYADVLRQETVPPEELLRILEETARAVAYAHSRGVVHRDLKPANLLVEEGGRVLLTDFGLARADFQQTRLTHGQAAMGTPQYMAPEQVAGRPDGVGPFTDVYALGVILYETLVGRPPFLADTPMELYQRILTDEPERPSVIRSAIDPDLEAITLKAIEKNSADRYPTALEFAEELRRHRAGEPVSARRTPRFSRLWRKARRHRTVLLPALAAAGLITFAGTSFVVNRIETSRRIRRILDGALGDESRGRAEEARLAFARILELDPGSEEARTGFERTEAESKRIRRRLEEEARAHAEAGRLLETGRPALEAAVRMLYLADADPTLHRRKVTEARSLFEQALERAPTMVPAHHLLGRAWDVEGWPEKAEACWKRAVELDPHFGPSHYQLGRLLLFRAFLLGTGTSEEDDEEIRNRSLTAVQQAAAEFNAAMNPGGGWDDDLQLHLARAMLAYASQDPDALRTLAKEGIARFEGREGVEEFLLLAGIVATGKEKEAHYDRALRLHPHFPLARFSRALHRRSIGDRKGALSDCDSALAVHPRFVEARYTRAALLHDLGNRDASLAEYDEVLRLRPEYPIACNSRGALRLELGDLDGALADFNDSLRHQPKQSRAYYNRGVVLKGRGDLAGAVRDYTEALRHNPRNVFALYNRGNVLHALERDDEALTDYGEAIRIDPDYLKPYLTRATLRSSRNDPVGAMEDLTEAIRLDPTLARAHYSRGRLRQMQGDLPGALADFDCAIKIDPGHASAIGSRGYFHLKTGDPARAIADFERALSVAPPDWEERPMTERLLREAREKQRSTPAPKSGSSP